MSISLIVAASENNVIGQDDRLLWRLPDDMAHFRNTTMGNIVVMGRATYESIPEKHRPLEGRTNVVLTRDTSYHQRGVFVVHNVDEALAYCGDTFFVAGGEQIYRQFLPIADIIHLTRVHTHLPGNKYFSQLGNRWEEVERAYHPADDRHAYAFSILKLLKRTP